MLEIESYTRRWEARLGASTMVYHLDDVDISGLLNPQFISSHPDLSDSTSITVGQVLTPREIDLIKTLFELPGSLKSTAKIKRIALDTLKNHFTRVYSKFKFSDDENPLMDESSGRKANNQEYRRLRLMALLINAGAIEIRPRIDGEISSMPLSNHRVVYRRKPVVQMSEVASHLLERFNNHAASEPIFNVVDANESVPGLPNEKKRKGVYLATNPTDGEDPKIYYLTRENFEILWFICTSPLDYAQMSLFFGKATSTLKNRLTSIYNVFNISVGINQKREYKEKNFLIARLIKLGILQYRPSIDEMGNPIIRNVLTGLEVITQAFPDNQTVRRRVTEFAIRRKLSIRQLKKVVARLKQIPGLSEVSVNTFFTFDK